MKKVDFSKQRSISLMTSPELTTVFLILMFLFASYSAVFAEEAPNGIDLWEVDGLHFPDYGASTNLILNPSFEAGFRYWGFLSFAQSVVPLEYTTFHIIDSNEMHSGSQSLRLLASGHRDPLGVGTFPIPVDPNTTYTLSFWAKNNSTAAKLYVWGRGRTTQLFSPSSILVYDPTSQWQRYTVSVAPQENFISIFFEGRGVGGTGYVWLDDIQFEEGSSATSYTQAPVSAQLNSTARGNFLEFGDAPNFALNIRSFPDVNGTVSLSVENFFFETIFEEEYEFTTDSNGQSTITLDDLDDDMEGLRGTFIVTGVFDVNDVNYTDYYRFSFMDFLDNTHKNKNLFNLTYVYQMQSGGPELDRFLTRERAIGFGSINYDFQQFANDLDYDLDEERMDKLDDYGFDHTGRPVLSVHPPTRGIISEDDDTYIMTGVNNITSPNSTQLSDFADICEIKAENRTWNDIWWFTGESYIPNDTAGVSGCMPLADFVAYPDSFAKFLIATCKGIKAGNPNAKVLIEGGPWNLDPNYGTLWVEKYIQDVNRIDPTVQFDGAAAHHYRNFPENPDLDSDVATFLQMLDDNGCEDWPFYINEGGCYPPFNIPEENMSPYVWNSANSWYMGPLTYHSGWAERISSAFTARNWLVALKYQDRVACMEDFMTPNRYMDVDFTPRFYDKMINTLGQLLGEASFDRDIELPHECRGYLFVEDTNDIPIAVIWGYNEDVDKWEANAPNYTFDFSSLNVNFIDLMENEVEFDTDINGRTIIPLSSFPLFIKGEYGTEDQLCEVLADYGTEIYTVMDGTLHNGSMTASSSGFWYNTPNAIPAGWTENSLYMYTTATMFAQAGTSGKATNNTGELVRIGHHYTVSADLGGATGSTATVKVYATENSNGTGDKVLLVCAAPRKLVHIK